MQTVGSIPVDQFDGGANVHKGATSDYTKYTLAELLPLLQMQPVGEVETAAAHPAVIGTYEDFNIVAALNAVLSSDHQIKTGERVMLMLTIEYVNAEAGINNVLYCHGGVASTSDKVRAYATLAAIASEYQRGVILVTDTDGCIKWQFDDITNLTIVFHLEGFQYVKSSAIT